MNIKLCCVGKLKDSFFLDACAEFSKRLSRYCSLSVHEVADEKAPEMLHPAEERKVKEREGERLLSAVDAKDYVIALTLGGRQYTSEAFSEHLAELSALGKHSVAFVIGGSLGLSDAVIKRADEQLCLSRMTFPHRLARLILLEQIYRAYRIERNEPYHK